MRRLVLLLLPAALAGPATAAAAAPASVSVVDCVSALAAEERTATFEARMRAVRRSHVLQVRFSLQVRAEDATSWTRVPAPGLDVWLSSDRGVRRYAYAKTVQNLSAPASYRVGVRFRWLDADGGAVRSTHVQSPACRQPDLRPDLVPARIDVLPARDEAERRYLVTVRNDGRTASAASSVGLRLGATDSEPLPLAPLRRGGFRVLAFTGPACLAGEPLQASVDPDGAVDERDEDANVLVAPCPG